MSEYTDLDGLEHLVLEESYVLEILARPGSLVFRVEVALAPDHPRYIRPTSDEVECFRRGRLSFTEVRSLIWQDQGAPPATDATGETDYGHIDAYVWNQDQHTLTGDFGSVTVVAGRPQVELDS